MANNPKAADLTIAIIGKPGTGKTTLALALNDFLRLRGFTDVTVVDPDLPHDHGITCEVNDFRLATIAGRDPAVCITAVQAPRLRTSPFPQYEQEEALG